MDERRIGGPRRRSVISPTAGLTVDRSPRDRGLAGAGRNSMKSERSRTRCRLHDHDLDQRHDRGRVEEVEADDLVGTQRGLADLEDERTEVLEEDRVAGVTASSSAKTACLIAIFSGTASITKSTSTELVVGDGAGDVGGDTSSRRASACSWVIFSFLTLLAAWPAVTFLTSLDRVIDELLVDITRYDRDVSCGDRLGDLTAHSCHRRRRLPCVRT